MNNEIALVTYQQSPDLTDGEQLLYEPLRHAGFEPKAIPWDSQNIDWGQFKAVVLRSSWDYHTRINEFKQWLALLESSGATVWNQILTLKWNLDKHYLSDLEKKGVPIIPTVYINQNAIYNLPSLLSTIDRPTMVIKPTFGASAFKVSKIDRLNTDEIQCQIQEHLNHSDVMIQPFMEEVIHEGEFSFIFFNKQFSHAVIKKPAPTDFRTQPYFGGTEHGIDANPDLVNQAKFVLDVIPDKLLYARVDGVNVDGKLLLMELELIEPYLFFEQSNQSASMFVSALKNLIGPIVS